tara:strand:+ start:1053 stop:1514 length:462 start_codon:yes stop_codon:yes gene_type:complete
MAKFDFHIQIGDTFSITDVDLDKLEKHTLQEYVLFLNKPNDKRSKDQIRSDTFNGLAAEHYMMDNYGYTNDNRKYKDLFSPCGKSVEIKTATSEERILKVIGQLTNRKSWAGISNYVIAFLRQGNDYVCHSLWEWNGQNYMCTNVPEYDTIDE